MIEMRWKGMVELFLRGSPDFGCVAIAGASPTAHAVNEHLLPTEANAFVRRPRTWGTTDHMNEK